MKGIKDLLRFAQGNPVRFGFSLLILISIAAVLTLYLTRAPEPPAAAAVNPAMDKQFEDRAYQLMEHVQVTYRKDGEAAATNEFEASARELLKDFPGRSEPYEMLVEVAAHEPPDKAKAIAQEVLSSPAPDEIKGRAQGLLAQTQDLGQPLALQYTAIDGRRVNLQSLHGKVVLVDFWATWCGPCIAELPNVKAAYDQFHAQGFEIIGVNFDQNKGSLESFIKNNGMAWPQYWDGLGWQSQFGEKFGVDHLPSMWLINKKGILVDMNGTLDLQSKVQKLLSEPE